MANQILFGGFQRLRNFALDPSSIHRTKEDLDNYLLNNPIAYPGQQVVVFADKEHPENNGAYVVVEGVNGLESRQLSDITVTNELSEKFGELKTLFDELETAITASINEVRGIATSAKDLSTELSGKMTGLESSVTEKIQGVKSDIDSKISQIEGNLTGNYESIINILGGYATIDSLDEYFAAFNKEDVQSLQELRKALNDINDWKLKHENMFDALLSESELYKAHLSDSSKIFAEHSGRILDLEQSLQFYALGSDLLKTKTDLEALISTVEAYVRQVELKIVEKSAFETKIKEIEDRISGVKTFSNVEEEISFEFGGNKGKFYILKNVEVRSVSVLIETPATEDTSFKVNIRNGINDEQLFEKDEIDIFSENTIFDYECRKTLGSDGEVRIYCNDFKGLSGRIFVKYISN